MDYSGLISRFKEISVSSNRIGCFEILKPILKERFVAFLDSKKKSKAGRPRTFDFDKFFAAFYSLVDDGSKISNFSITFPTIFGSFKRYFRNFRDSGILEEIHNGLLDIAKRSHCNIVDSFVVKSCDGSELTGKNYLDRGRNGIKVTLICDTNQVVHNFEIFPANKGENNCLKNLLEKQPVSKRTSLFADSGYIGREISQYCSSKRVRLIAKPRRTRPKKGYPQNFKCASCQRGNNCNNGKTCVNSKNYEPGQKLSHELSKRDQKTMERERNKIEWINGRLRRSRGINIKYTKKIISYKTMLLFVIICNNLHRLSL